MDGNVADRHVRRRCSRRRISSLQVQRQSEAHQDPDQGWLLLHRREPAVQNCRGETFLFVILYACRSIECQHLGISLYLYRSTRTMKGETFVVSVYSTFAAL